MFRSIIIALISLFVILLNSDGLANDRETDKVMPLKLGSYQEGAFFGRHIYWYRGNDSFESISSPQFQQRFTRGKNNTLAFGIDYQTYWFRFTIRHASAAERSLYLYFQDPPFDMEVFVDGHQIKTLSWRQADYKNSHVTLPVAATETTVFLKKQTRVPVSVNWRLFYSQERLTSFSGLALTEFSVIVAIVWRRCGPAEAGGPAAAAGT